MSAGALKPGLGSALSRPCSHSPLPRAEPQPGSMPSDCTSVQPGWAVLVPILARTYPHPDWPLFLSRSLCVACV